MLQGFAGVAAFIVKNWPKLVAGSVILGEFLSKYRRVFVGVTVAIITGGVVYEVHQFYLACDIYYEKANFQGESISDILTNASIWAGFNEFLAKWFSRLNYFVPVGLIFMEVKLFIVGITFIGSLGYMSFFVDKAIMLMKIKIGTSKVIQSSKGN